jgi:predicted nucleic acid-binding protein
MSAAIVLDSTPLGILYHPRNPPHVMACRRWVNDLLIANRRVIVPEIADYEVRRELVRLGSRVALTNLDQLGRQLEFCPITTSAMRMAADLWASARNAGRPTAPDLTIDADVILSAPALTMNTPVVVATANPGHLMRFVPAEIWSNITP